MQLFERWFAVWPDGGNGLLEFAYVVTAVAVLVVVAARRPLARALRKLRARASALSRRP
jgi:hypothetical protein